MNRKLKKIIQIFLLLLCSKSFCSSDFQWNISVGLGIKSGESDELVFENGEKISLLKWENPYLPQINIKNQMELNNLVFDGEAKIDFTLGLYCTPALKLSLPFGIGDKTLKADFNLVSPVTKTLATWEFL